MAVNHDVVGSTPTQGAIEPIDASMETVVEKLVNPPTKKPRNLKSLIPYKGANPPTPAQGAIDKLSTTDVDSSSVFN